MIGAIVGLMVGQDDVVPLAPATGRAPRPNPAMLATVAAVHSVAFAVTPARALRDLRARHPSIAGMPGVSGFLREEDFWEPDVVPEAEGFAPWPIVASWLCPSDFDVRIHAMMEIAYPIPGDHFTSTMASAETVRSLLEGTSTDEVSESLLPFYRMADTGSFPVASATAAGLKAGLAARTFDEAVLPFSGREEGYDRGNAAFVAGAVASTRFDIPGWGYLAACDLAEDVVQGGMDVFEALLADPSLGAARSEWVGERAYAEAQAPAPEEPAPTADRGSRSLLAALRRRLSLSRG